MESILLKFQSVFGSTGYDNYDMVFCCFFIGLFTVLMFRLFSDIIHKL